MTTPTFRGSTADDVAEQIATYIRTRLKSGATSTDALAMVMRTESGFVGTVCSRQGLLTQLEQMSPPVAASIRREVPERADYIPLVALDIVEQSQGVEWIGPFPNATGGTA